MDRRWLYLEIPWCPGVLRFRNSSDSGLHWSVVHIDLLFTLFHRTLLYITKVRTHFGCQLLRIISRRMSTSPYETLNWPTSSEHLSAARQFLLSLSKKEDDRPVLILPDRDVDGLTSGGIMHRVLSRVLLKDRKIDVPVQFITKGAWIGDHSEKAKIDAVNPRYSLSEGKLIKSCYRS